jgi:hypothetical protein
MIPGSRRAANAAGRSESEFSNAAELIPQANITQAAAPPKTASLSRYDPACRPLPGSREGRIIDWLQAVSRDSRIGVLHRFCCSPSLPRKICRVTRCRPLSPPRCRGGRNDRRISPHQLRACHPRLRP